MCIPLIPEVLEAHLTESLRGVAYESLDQVFGSFRDVIDVQRELHAMLVIHDFAVRLNERFGVKRSLTIQHLEHTHAQRPPR